MRESELEQKINQYFNEEYSGRYRSSLDIDYDSNTAIASIAFEDGSEKPGIGSFIDEIINELGLDNPRLEADWQPEENIYTINIHEKQG
ncbi:MAG: hypothetical protein ABEK00_01320 [Candidatus Nanohaloarchaea archaeon]